MQTQLSREQLALSSIFCTQPAPTAAAQQASEERYNDIQQEIMEEIEEKQERILELRKEIGDDEEALLNAEEDELLIEPCEGEEDIYSCDCIVPQMEEDLTYTRYENEQEIKEREDEILELERQLK